MIYQASRVSLALAQKPEDEENGRGFAREAGLERGGGVVAASAEGVFHPRRRARPADARDADTDQKVGASRRARSRAGRPLA